MPRGCSSATSWSTGARGSSSSRASSSRSSTCSPSASACPTSSGRSTSTAAWCPYTAFVAPGLLASSAMNGAMLDSTFLVFFKLKIAKTYDAMLSTPLGVGDVALGRAQLVRPAGRAVLGRLPGHHGDPGLHRLAMGRALLAGGGADQPRLRVRRHGRHHLHADLAGLRHGLAGLHPAVPLLGDLLPAHRVPRVAPGRRALHPPLPGSGARAAPPTWVSGAGLSWATSPTWWRWRSAGSSSPGAASAHCSCRNRPPRSAGTVGPHFPERRGPDVNEHRGEQRQGGRGQDDHRRLPGRGGGRPGPRAGPAGRRRPPGFDRGVVRRRPVGGGRAGRRTRPSAP